MEPLKPRNFPRPGSDVIERERINKVQAAQKVCSLIVQNERKVYWIG